ncbi:putative Zn-dependent protease [Fodinibius salinus]|uniref:Putative Zn-dependent protease n=1 Tax=Fodinibius salinus TaxID=860790 RepID=A0A5D3YR02_9BACT|nr:M48 family metalloprotease [Fodinibius salinus]TYP94971.1 putative Zn-dependent protease [Fodinibius salinus]
MKTTHLRNIILLVVVGLFISSCAVQRSPITGNKRAYGYSWEKELKIGEQSDKQIQQQYGVYGDEKISHYVNDIGQELLSVSHMRRENTSEKYRQTEFTFRVLNSPITNAFALPGGYVYVTRGMLAHLENEAQLAVVLGHEIGHVAARHSSQRALEQQVGQIALIGGAVAGQELLDVPAKNILGLGSQAAQFLFLSYSRDDERESDQLGVEYAAMKNYEAANGAGFFSALKRISAQSGQSIPDWQSSHPDPAERANTIPDLAREWREKGYKQNIENTDEFMNTIDGMIYGNNPRNGFSDDNMFYHPDLAFQFSVPSNWKVQNQPSQVAVFNEQQDAVTVMKIDDKSSTPKASVSNVINQEEFRMQSQNEVRHNGLNGFEATATAMTKDSTQYKFYLYAVSYNSDIYQFTSYSVADKFSNYSRYFRQTSNSFAELNDQQILDIKPTRLEVRKTDRSAPFSSFLPSNFPMDITAEDVAILNQVQLDETIEAGSWIKIPRQ